MANRDDLMFAKSKVQEELKNRVAKNSNIGIYEFAKQELTIMGIDTSKMESVADIDKAIKELPQDKKRMLGKDLKEYKKEYDEAIKQINNGVYSGAKNLPKKAIETIVKGAGIGMSVAGIVNTVAPGLLPYTLGYINGTVAMNTLVKLGLVTVGVFTPPEFAHGAILYAGAAIGATVYAAGKLGLKAIKGINKKIKSKNEQEEYER